MLSLAVSVKGLVGINLGCVDMYIGREIVDFL